MQLCMAGLHTDFIVRQFVGADAEHLGGNTLAELIWRAMTRREHPAGLSPDANDGDVQ
jgi:hypothetical protein